MADLHKFQDDAQSKEDRVKPVKARMLDENFRTVRLKLSDKFALAFRITQSAAQSDVLDLSLSVPTSGKHILGVEDGQLKFFETDEC